VKVLVLGASRGIGLELVRQCVADGHRVTATARDEAGLAQLTSIGAKAIRLDVAATASCAALPWQIDGEAFDQAWLVAGVIGPRTTGLEPPTEADFDTVMHTNVLAAMRLLPPVAETLAPGGKLLVISSVMGSIGQRSNPGVWLYRASKAALNSVLRDVSFTLKPPAVCAALHPGWVRTDMGGAGAALDVDRSVADLRATADRLTSEMNGQFFNHDGAPLPW
jgi:NAD(P)-dependent dehydrogenase (short-subunit alcohol dehydrogenase family)